MRPFYRFAYFVVGCELKSRHRIRIEGREHLPTGGFLAVANHVSFWDPTTVGWALEREIYYLARKSLFKPPFWNWFLPICNVLPINQEAHDLSGLRRIIRLLQKGEVVLLFPEGTRSPNGRLLPPEPGAGFIAAQAKVPVLPVRLFGTFEVLSRRDWFPKAAPIRVAIGAPYLPVLRTPEGKKRSPSDLAAEMMDRIAHLS